MQLIINLQKLVAAAAKGFLLFFCVAATASCGSHHGDGPILIDPPSYDMERILFKEGLPKPEDTIESSLTDITAGTRSLRAAIVYLSDNSYLRVQVNGFSDKAECRGATCDALSSRRALLIYDWLKSNGVSERQLCGYAGLGTTEPVDFSDTETQRQNNRRVEFKASRMSCQEFGSQ